MNRLPEVGERVRYHKVCEHGEEREVTGVVTKIYEGFERDSLAVFPVGKPGWTQVWHAVVQIDYRPDWFGYTDPFFAPTIDELEPAPGLPQSSPEEMR